MRLKSILTGIVAAVVVLQAVSCNSANAQTTFQPPVGSTYARTDPMPPGVQDRPGEATNCIVSVIDEAIVPAQEAGVLTDLNTPTLNAEGQQVVYSNAPAFQRTTEGLHVRTGQVLGHVDDKLALVNKKVAEQKVAVAEAEAGNDVNKRYAEKAWEVAKAKYKQAQQANDMVKGTVPYIEMLRYQLEVEQFGLQIEQAVHDLKIAEVSVAVREAELEAAQEQIERRTIRAPFDGVIVEVFSNQGEWLEPGSPVLKIVRMDTLHVKGFQSLAQVPPSHLEGKSVTITVPYVSKPFEGRVDFVNPTIMQGDRYQVRAAIQNQRDQNGNWLLRPGMRADMKIHIN